MTERKNRTCSFVRTFCAHVFLGSKQHLLVFLTKPHGVHFCEEFWFYGRALNSFINYILFQKVLLDELRTILVIVLRNK